MNFIKRAVLSISRRPGKSLILFLVILIIGNLIAGTVAVRQATSQSEEMAKQLLGASVSIGLDDQALVEAYNKGEEPEIGSLSADLIESLGQLPEVRSFDYTLTTYLPSKTLKNYQPDEETDGVTAIVGGSDANAAYFSLHGVHYAPILLVEEGKLSITEGRVFTDEDINENRLVAVIPDKVAETNNLHVGDTIVLINQIEDWSATEEATDGSVKILDSRDVVLEVIGIFAMNSGAEDLAAADEDGSTTVRVPSTADYAKSELYNTIYVPIGVTQAEDEFAMEGYRRIAEAAGDPWAGEAYQPYYSPIYLLNSVDDLESFEQAATEQMPAFYRVLSAQSQYEQIAAPMKNIQQIMGVALIVVIIAALVIISLVVVLFLRDRRREFGIYLSLGTRKPAIIGQVVIEVLIIAVIALAISLFTGNLISGGISGQMIENQLATQGADALYGGIAISYVGGDASLLAGDLSVEDVINSYQVGFSLPYALTFLGIGLGSVVLSCVVPLLYVLRLKPKKILM